MIFRYLYIYNRDFLNFIIKIKNWPTLFFYVGRYARLLSRTERREITFSDATYYSILLEKKNGVQIRFFWAKFPICFCGTYGSRSDPTLQIPNPMSRIRSAIFLTRPATGGSRYLFRDGWINPPGSGSCGALLPPLAHEMADIPSFLP